MPAQDRSLKASSTSDFPGSGPAAHDLANADLQACALPAAWAHRLCWTVLETGFDAVQNFLAIWQAWQRDPARPRMLHVVASTPAAPQPDQVLHTAALHPDWLPLARQLNAQLWGLLPGTHRLVFADGQVLLTLLMGDVKTMLRSQRFAADSIFLNDTTTALPGTGPFDAHFAKTIARCCTRGARVVARAVTADARAALTQSGFVIDSAPLPAGSPELRAVYDPPWLIRRSAAATEPPAVTAARCVVIGAGLAGAAVAASLARRGWAVQVLDAADRPASGASSLPAGVLAPHVSPDDSLLSQLSRSGVRATLQQAGTWLQPGRDWQPSGVLERSLGATPRRPPADWQTGMHPPTDATSLAARDWLQPASAAQLAACGLPPDAPALWHGPAGWIKPAALVQAWLKTPGVRFCGGAAATQLRRLGKSWEVLDASGATLATAELVVLAASMGSRALAQHAVPPATPLTPLTPATTPLALQAIRGQVSWRVQANLLAASWPAFPVNGAGSLIAAVPCGEGANVAQTRLSLWGATYQRDALDLVPRTADAAANAAQLGLLAPALAPSLTDIQPTPDATGSSGAWTGVRCATPTRLPMVGPLLADKSDAAHSVWICTGMGSRGLTFAALCAELLAARLHGEPAPIDDRMAAAMAPRFDADVAS